LTNFRKEKKKFRSLQRITSDSEAKTAFCTFGNLNVVKVVRKDITNTQYFTVCTHFFWSCLASTKII